MSDLTKIEKIIILFVFSSLLVYTTVHYYRIKEKTVERCGNSTLTEEGLLTKPININTATEEEMALLDGIGPALAARIISYRETNGLFSSKEDIMKVKGIGPKKFAKFKDSISIE